MPSARHSAAARSRRSAVAWGLAAAVAAAVALGGVQPAAGQPAATGRTLATEAPVVGSPFGPDPYFRKDGNGGYDVDRYRIRNRYVPAGDRLRGRTVVEATTLTGLSAFHLDLALTPDRVVVDGRRARFAKTDRHTLRVTPATPLAAGERFVTKVWYHGRPSSARAAGMASPFAHRLGEGVAMGEPQNGPWWFAANETPGDKATYRIQVKVPRGQQAVSNGELVSRTRKGGWTTWKWQMTDPMSTYLAFFVAGRFALDRGTVGGRPSVTAVSKQLSRSQQAHWTRTLGRTGRVVRWLEARFGPYPFTSVGGVAVAAQPDYALETQSRPVYPGTYYGGIWLVVHEQAHQWFGDSVSLRRWRDIWLNEGFATYAEWLWDEDHDDWTVDDHLRDNYRGASSSFWDVRISDPGPDELFGSPVYLRGGMTLAALRNVIGADDHARLLRRWAAEHRHGTVDGADFRALAEEVSGRELDAFFAAWLDARHRPADTEANGLGSLLRG
jgi:aminopeptidase N